MDNFLNWFGLRPGKRAASRKRDEDLDASTDPDYSGESDEPKLFLPTRFDEDDEFGELDEGLSDEGLSDAPRAEPEIKEPETTEEPDESHAVPETGKAPPKEELAKEVAALREEAEHPEPESPEPDPEEEKKPSADKDKSARKDGKRVLSFQKRTTIDYLIAGLAVLLVLTVIAFGAFYGYDRYRITQEATPMSRVAPQIEERVRQNPQDPTARVALADAYLREGRAGEAINQFEQALKLDETNQYALVGIGLAYMEQGDYHMAEEYFGQQIDHHAHGEFAKTNRYLETAYHNMGIIHFEKGNYEESVNYTMMALEIRATDADSQFLLGRAHYEMGEYEHAILDFERATQFDPKFADPHYGLGLCYEALGDEDRARYHYEKALDIDPDFTEARRSLDALR